MLSSYTFDKYFWNSFFDEMNHSNESECYITNTDKELTIEMSVPGASKQDLTVDVVEGTLLVNVKPKVKSKLAREVKRSWKLGDNVDIDNIGAKLENGILTLTVPKRLPIKKSVTITVS